MGNLITQNVNHSQCLHNSSSLVETESSNSPNPLGSFPKKQGLQEEVVLGGSALFIASICGNGLNYLFGMFLGRMLGTELFGTYALGLTIFNTLSLIFLVGLNTGATRFVSKYLSLGSLPLARNTIVISLLATMVISTFAGLFLIVVSPFVALSFYKNPTLYQILQWFGFAIPCIALTTVALANIQAFHIVKYTIAIKFLIEPLGKFALAGMFLGMGFGLDGVLWAIVVALAISVLFSLQGIFTVAGLRIKNFLSFSTHSSQARELFTFCIPLSLANVFGIVAPRLDIIFLGYFLGPHIVAVYSAAFQTAATLGLVLAAFEGTFAPAIGQALATKDTEKLTDLNRLLARLLLTLTVPLFICISVFSSEILNLFGNDFVPGWKCLILLAASHLAISVAGGPNLILLMGGHSRLVLFNNLLLGGLMTVSLTVFVPSWGFWGAAMATALSQIMLNLIRALEVWFLYAIHPFTHSLLKPLAAGLLTGGMVFLVKENFNPFVYPFLIFLGILIYVALLWCFKLDPKDRLIFDNLLSKFNFFSKNNDQPLIKPAQ